MLSDCECQRVLICYLGVIERVRGSRRGGFSVALFLVAPVFFSISAGLPLLPMATTSV